MNPKTDSSGPLDFLSNRGPASKRLHFPLFILSCITSNDSICLLIRVLVSLGLHIQNQAPTSDTELKYLVHFGYVPISSVGALDADLLIHYTHLHMATRRMLTLACFCGEHLIKLRWRRHIQYEAANMAEGTMSVTTQGDEKLYISALPTTGSVEM